MSPTQKSDTPPDTATPSAPSNWALIRRMLALAWRYRASCLFVLSQQILLVLISLGGLGLTGLGIDVIRSHVDPTASPARWPLGLAPPATWQPLTVIALIALAILGMAGIHAGIRFLNAISTAKLAQSIVVQLRSDVYDKLQRLSFRFFDSHESGSIINRVIGDVQAVRSFVDGVILRVLTVLLSLTAYLVYMLNVHVPLTLACLATTPLLWVGAIWFSRRVRPAYTHNSKLVDHMILTLSENLQGVHVVKGFAREDDEIEKFRAANQGIRDQKERIFWTLSLFQPTIGFLTQINLVVLLLYGGYLVIQGQILLGEGLFVFANLLQEFANQVGQTTNIANSIQTSLTGAQRVFEVLDAPIEVQSPPVPIPLKRARGAIRFENVQFGYHRDQPVLQNIDFEVEPGECVAIVGSTGAGKSTLLSLIPRFYDPMAGRVLIDGVDIRRIDLDDLRRNIGLVFQESFLFSNTAAANIAFGHPEASSEQIEQAAKVAAAHQFVSRLPKGYDTVIGEHGSNLSGGQRQRLAIARALLLDPPILILDDAMAAIDAQTESEILEAMDQAIEGRTTFVIAHRLSTLRRADRILVLEKGRIVQMGDHEELMRQSGHYRHVARLQIVDTERDELAVSAREVA